MTREFVLLPEFEKQWAEIGLTDNELKALQEELTINPNKGDMMKETGGLRKIRVAFEGSGKSGSARACYVDFVVHEKIYLITAYTKKDKDNLTKKERNEIKRLIGILKNSLDGR